jgi:enoyl-CoA hydratase
VEAGFFDKLVAPERLAETAQALAVTLAKLNTRAHAASKVRARAKVLEALRAAIAADDADLRKVWGLPA